MTQPLSHVASPTLNIQALKASCAGCSMHQLCLPMGLDEADIKRLDEIMGRRRRVQRGEHLYRMQDAFVNLYAIRFGHFKTYQINASGEQQITGFQMGGELLGMDAIGTDSLTSNSSKLKFYHNWPAYFIEKTT